MSYAIAGSPQVAALGGSVTYPILELVRMCALIMFCGTLLIIIVGTQAHEWKLNFTKPIMDRLAHLEAAYELVKAHATTQKVELVQRRLENEQLTDAFGLLNKHVAARKNQAVQLQLDNEQLKGLVRTLTLINEDQEAGLRRAEQRAAVIEAQNAGLANKIMTMRRHVFQLEQERREQKVLLQGQIDIKTLVKENTNAIRALDKRVSSKDIKSSGSDSEQGRGCFTPSSQSSHISSTARSIAHARQLQHVIRNILVGGCSIERTLTRFLSSRSCSRSLSPTIEETDTSLTSADQLEKSLRPLFAQVYTITDFACALTLAQEQFQSRSNMTCCGSEESRRFDSVTCLGMSTEIACG
ncbi:hypothetical protein PMIN07_009221 [Paraphaeosphaeria minitans]